MSTTTHKLTPHLPGISGPSGTPEIEQLLQPLRHLNLEDHGVHYSPITTATDGKRFQIERFVFIGPDSGHQTVRLGVFAGLGRQDRQSPAAVVRFLQDLVASPELATGVHLYFYPVAFPSATEDHNSRTGDLFKSLWIDSSLPEPYLLERELAVIQFHGVVTLLGLGHLSGISLQLHGIWTSLQTSLLQPAIQAASRYLPLAQAGDHTASQKISLTTGGDLSPRPFEISIKIPRETNPHSQIQAQRAALHSILQNYRAVISHAQNI